MSAKTDPDADVSKREAEHEYRIRQEFAARLKLARMGAGFHDPDEFAGLVGVSAEA